MVVEISKYTIDDFKIGQKHSINIDITLDQINSFSKLTGDVSTLHMNDDFAKSRGFRGRVVHGVLLAGFISQLIGVRFPGENCLLQSLQLNFFSPAYINDTVEISAVVEQISKSTNTLLLKITIINLDTKKILVKGKAMTLLTSSK